MEVSLPFIIMGDRFKVSPNLFRDSQENKVPIFACLLGAFAKQCTKEATMIKTFGTLFNGLSLTQ